MGYTNYDATTLFKKDQGYINFESMRYHILTQKIRILFNGKL